MTASIEPRIKVSINGPYVVTGGVPIGRLVIAVDEAGNSREWRQTHAYARAITVPSTGLFHKPPAA